MSFYLGACLSFPLRRGFRSSAVVLHGHGSPKPALTSENSVEMHWVSLKTGSKTTVRGRIGDSLLDVSKEHDLGLEGACEGSCACSTCHLILQSEVFDSLPEPSDEENDMLDMAFGLTENSRLGCQVIVSREFEGTRIEIPEATRNFAVDGYVPKHH